MRYTRHTLVCCATALLALPLAASAAHRKPGLWETTVQLNFVKGGPQIPPAQLQQMKQMGIQLPFNRPTTVKQCLTAEQAAKEEAPSYGRNKDCQMKNAHYSGSTFSGDLVCNSQDMKGTGTIKATFDSDTQYHGTMHFAGTSPQHGGGEVEMNNEFTGRWISADCGTVKPLPSH
jgi:hypothetical protein